MMAKVHARVTSYTGKETYQFGDVASTALTSYTGKETYQFGDVTRTAVQSAVHAVERAVKTVAPGGKLGSGSASASASSDQ